MDEQHRQFFGDLGRLFCYPREGYAADARALTDALGASGSRAAEPLGRSPRSPNASCPTSWRRRSPARSI
jgi:hypothetical protein